jgi:hypothetical protein
LTLNMHGNRFAESQGLVVWDQQAEPCHILWVSIDLLDPWSETEVDTRDIRTLGNAYT